MFKSEADIVDKSEYDSGPYDADIIIPGMTDIRVNPVEIAS